MSTIFISHSSADNALAIELFDWLKSQGYRSVFLDLDPNDGIEAGKRWEKVLYRELVSCSVVLALVTEDWSTSQWCFTEITHARSGGKPILGLTTSRNVQPAILADTQLIDYSLGNRTEAYQRLAEALRRAIDPQGMGHWNSTRPLFPGLLIFDEKDAPIFFGRRRLGRAIYQKLREIQSKPPESERLLLVFGPSGSGKSSVVRAGTLPHIRADRDTWITLGPFRPTEGWPEPLRQSMNVLIGSDERAIVAKLGEIADQLRDESKTPKASILLIIDQLEEALDAQDGIESEFWLALSRLLALNNTPFMAMATLRSDFMGDFQKRSGRHAVRFASFPMEPMSPQDIREVVTGPCRVAGIDIEPSLVDVLVEDIGDEQALPLLSLALNRLWLRYEDKQGDFTVSNYRDSLKGMQGLINREAESILAGNGLQAALVLDAFLNLIRLAREGVFVRHPVDWEELEPEAKKILKPFIDAHLLVSDVVDGEKSEGTESKHIDLAHEILLSGWERLYKCLASIENRDFLLWREELRHKVSRWSQAKRRNIPLTLLEGAELKEAKKWLHSKRLALTKQEAAYIQAGIDANKISRAKLAVAAGVLMTVGVGGWEWTQTDLYQIIKIESTFPEAMRSSIASHEDSEELIQSTFPQLVDFGHADLAIIAADKIDDAVTMADALKNIAQALIEAGQTQQALAVADKIDFAREKADALKDIAQVLVKAGQTQQALAVADKIDDAWRKADALKDIAQVLVKAGQTQQAVQTLARALAVADKIDFAWGKADALKNIAQALIEAGQTQQALTVADKIDDAVTKADALKDIAPVLVKAGQTQQAVQTLARALAVADKIDIAWRKADALKDIAQMLVKAGQTQQAVQTLARALAVADKIDDAETKTDALKDIALALIEAGQTQQALAVADKIDDTETKADALKDIALALIEAGQTQQALAVADKIDDAVAKADALKDIAQVLVKAGQTQQAVQTLARALAVADKIDFAWEKADTLKNIAQALIEAGQTQQALAVADKIDDAEKKVDTLNEMAIALAHKRMIGPASLVLSEAIQIIENYIPAEIEKSKAYGNIATTYARLTQYHTARVTAEKAKFANDTLNGYMDILKYYAIEQNPKLAEKLAKHEEDKS
jgi:tetratricopeptide (TPR) repeat protein